MTFDIFTYSNLFKNEKLCNLEEYCTKSYLRGHFAIVYPAHSGKICRFGTVKAMIETSMVTVRKGNHELSSFLSNLRTETETGRTKGKIHLNT